MQKLQNSLKENLPTLVLPKNQYRHTKQVRVNRNITDISVAQQPYCNNHGTSLGPLMTSLSRTTSGKSRWKRPWSTTNIRRQLPLAKFLQSLLNAQSMTKASTLNRYSTSRRKHTNQVYEGQLQLNDERVNMHPHGAKNAQS